jgi:hypothetical protein
MRSHIPLAVVLLAASSVTLAAAQPAAPSQQVTQPPAQAKGQGAAPAPAANAAMSDANTPDYKPDVTSQAVSASGRKQAASPSLPFVQAPIATATKAQGNDAQLADSIVKALDADPSLKDSKITVQADQGKVWLTGATLTRAQKEKVGQIAMAQAGENKVVNVVLDDET